MRTMAITEPNLPDVEMLSGSSLTEGGKGEGEGVVMRGEWIKVVSMGLGRESRPRGKGFGV